jgi:hypothetical protein
MVTRITLSAIPEGIPESFPPVHYFLQEINTPEWIMMFRIAAAVIVIAAAIIIAAYTRKHPADDERKEKK